MYFGGAAFASRSSSEPGCSSGRPSSRIRAVLSFASCTFGYGPRYLHSTGQYHKGGPANGLFIQLYQRASEDVEIPEAGYSFEHLKSAQALGDMQTLRAHGLQVVRIEVDGPDAVRGLI